MPPSYSSCLWSGSCRKHCSVAAQLMLMQLSTAAGGMASLLPVLGVGWDGVFMLFPPHVAE